MTVYATPFDGATMNWRGPSIDSGFETLDQVRRSTDDEPITVRPSLLIYRYGREGLAFSYALFHIDGRGNSDYSVSDNSETMQQ